MDYSALARKITTTLFLTMSLGSAGILVAGTVSSIVAAELGGNAAWAGLPTAAFLAGTALSALLWGYAMDRLGRRGSLALGLLLGAVGSGLAAMAVVDRALFPFLGALALTGFSNSVLQLGRFAAAEVHPPAARGRALSTVVLGGTVGAVLGPWVAGPMGGWSLRAGLGELAGPYVASLALYFLAALLVFARLRPDPRDLGRQVAALHPEDAQLQGRLRRIGEILRDPAPLTAMAVMVAGQMIMVMLMVITSVHMKAHQHGLTDISLVISSHTFGMYAFSIFSGQLADRWGRLPVILVGLGTLVLACLLAPLSPQVLPLAVSLFLLGLGWNFCFVGGSALLADNLSPLERAKTQGFNDTMIALASGTGSLGSGLVFAAVGYGAMSLAGILVALVPLGLILRWQLLKLRPALPQSTHD